jgi:hypothetical protein
MKAMTDSMFELERILRHHADRYPLMQPTDAVKLIYQNEFGGGHLIRDEESCLGYLRGEYAALEKDANAPIAEEIGNGILRVNLAAVQAEELERLGKTFIRSALAHTGTLDSFLQKLEVLRQLAREGVFCFDAQGLEAYLSAYEMAGYPMVSHSETYRQNYRPAYRVVLQSLWQ